MLKHAGRAAALAGLLLSLGLIWNDDPGAVLGLMRTAGAGLALAALAHLLPVLVNACGWRTLILGGRRPGLAATLYLTWIREAVNSMLPVARIGGEVVAFRLLRHWGVRPSTAVASLIADMQLTVLSQLLFTMVGIGFLFAHTQSHALRLARDLAWGVVAIMPLLVLFALVQHASPFERLARLANRTMGDKFVALVGKSARIDRSIKLIWRRRGLVLRFLFVWQPLQCLATSLEIWLALYFLGARVSLAEAVVIESLIQALSSAAFFVPGGLGVQEGGFMLIGGALGLDPSICLALAGARRLRDLLIFVPGLCAWQFAERSRKGAARLPALGMLAAVFTASRAEPDGS